MMLVALILCPLLALPQAAPAEAKGPETAVAQGAPADPKKPADAKPPADPKAPQDPPPKPPEEVGFFKTIIKQITLGGQIRTRAEYRYPTAYTNTPTTPPATITGITHSDDQFLTRVRINLKFLVTDDIEVFFQPQDQRTWGQEASVLSDEKNFDVHQAFLEVRNILGEPFSVKVGRMELSYGDQRLVSPLDWSNFGRAWDGAKIRYAPEDWWIEAFFTVLRDPLAPAVFNGGGTDQDFLGVYFSFVGVKDHEFDVYCFGREFHDGSVTAEDGVTVGDLVDWTYGIRVKGKALGFDYSGELIGQSGHFSADRIGAYAYALTLGYTADLPWTPRVGVEYDFASGDRNPADGRRNTFDPLFPFGHYFQGFADVFEFKNGRDLSLYLKAAPVDKLTVQVDYHFFWLGQRRDAWYSNAPIAGTNMAGAVVRRNAAGAANPNVGQEIDIHARYAIGKFVKFWGGWSRFFPGPFVRQTPGETIGMNWFFIQMTVDF